MNPDPSWPAWMLFSGAHTGSLGAFPEPIVERSPAVVAEIVVDIEMALKARQYLVRRFLPDGYGPQIREKTWSLCICSARLLFTAAVATVFNCFASFNPSHQEQTSDHPGLSRHRREVGFPDTQI
jgi:hypothetical protein